MFEARQIQRTFDEQTVFKELSFSVKQGEILGIWGPNGCGKSTLLRIVAGLEQPDNELGEVSRIISAKEVGFVPQDPLAAILPWYKTTSNVRIHSNRIIDRPAGAVKTQSAHGAGGNLPLFRLIIAYPVKRLWDSGR